MRTTKKAPAFNVFVKVTFDLYLPVAGATFEEALAEARKLKASDCLEVPNGVEVNDHDITLEGVHLR